MNWNKYTLEQWLEQFGAWLEQTTQKGGDLPDGLHINQIYWLMQSVNPTPRKNQRICYISDDEAMEINNILRRAVRTAPDKGNAIKVLIARRVEGKSLSDLEVEFKLSRPAVTRLIECGRYYLLGMDFRFNT